MTDGEVASAQSSGLVKPFPPLLPSPPLQLRAVMGARVGGEAIPRACVCARDYPPTPLRTDAAGLVCHLQKRNKRGIKGLSLMGKLAPLCVTRAVSLLLPGQDSDPQLFRSPPSSAQTPTQGQREGSKGSETRGVVDVGVPGVLFRKLEKGGGGPARRRRCGGGEAGDRAPRAALARSLSGEIASCSPTGSALKSI